MVQRERARWATALLRSARRDDALRNAIESAPAVHLVVLREPHLSRIIRGEKRLEARACRVRRAPMGCVSPGDLLLLKRAAGDVEAWCVAANAITHDAAAINELRRRHDAALASPGDAFWDSVRAARYLTLIELESVTPLERPIRCAKPCRRSWVVLRRTRC